jgi:hypothetical protein
MFIVKIYKQKGRIMVERFKTEDQATRWAANAAKNGYAVLPITEETK